MKYRTISTHIATGLAATLAAITSLSAQEAEPQKLSIGDPAPPLVIGEWVKGKPVEAFAADQVYVVEFWATWCGPCIAGMPHLSELQEAYADKGVQIIGVNIWDEPEKVKPFLKDEVKMHKKTGDEIMRYTIAIEEKHDPENVRNGKMALTWMTAAGQNGIPSAFIIDGKQRVAWIGHPATMDKPLEKIVAGEWDIENAAKEIAAKNAAQAEFRNYTLLFRKGDFEAAYPIARKMVSGAFANEPMALNSIAWGIIDPDNPPKVQDLELALEAAMKANELTESKNAMILDTLAMAYSSNGNLQKAVEYQKLAVEHADDRIKADLQKRLTEFEKKVAE
ncbi:MAG: redoxin family protein [Verrucomicrobiae bacterium]|nr:redoxin family protein [Verrucomicrobiae bacterium]